MVLKKITPYHWAHKIWNIIEVREWILGIKKQAKIIKK